MRTTRSAKLPSPRSATSNQKHPTPFPCFWIPVTTPTNSFVAPPPTRCYESYQTLLTNRSKICPSDRWESKGQQQNGFHAETQFLAPAQRASARAPKLDRALPSVQRCKNRFGCFARIRSAANRSANHQPIGPGEDGFPCAQRSVLIARFLARSADSGCDELHRRWNHLAQHSQFER